MPAYYPVGLDLAGRKCLVVGGGKVAERKVRSLLEVGAQVVLISPQLTPGLAVLAGRQAVTYCNRHYHPADLEGAFLIISATDNSVTNGQVARDAQARGLLVNVVDKPELCNFIVPAVVRRADFSLSIATGGKSPMLARKIREKLEMQFGPEYGALVDLLGKVRGEINAKYTDQEHRQQIWAGLVERLLRQLELGQELKIEEQLLDVCGYGS
jgi:precorrin-2 dehydrogenase/sirohydrochlorin ferrochelatase